MKHVAILEGDERIYLGVETIEDEALTKDHVEVPEKVDLSPGNYRWDGTAFVRRMAHVAILDGDERTYRGVEAIDYEALTKEHVEVPADCDLVPGNYRWDGATFVPLAEVSRTPRSGSVPLEVAFHGLVGQLAAAGIDVGPGARAWAKQFEKTVDAMKAAAFGGDKQ